jgi:ferredoxin
VDECRIAGYDALEFMRVGGRMDDRGEPVEGSGWLAPVVREEKCVGCGLCQMRCHAVNVKTRKLLHHSAIRVVAGEGKEDRLLTGSYLDLRAARIRRIQEQTKASRPEDKTDGAYLPDFLK